MLQVRAKILYNKKIKGNYFHLLLRAPKIAKESIPGKFLNVKVSDTCEPLLRRPLSIHMAKGANVGLLYEVVGQATQILSRRKPGEHLDVIGPLGNGFNYPLSLPVRQAGAIPALPAGRRYPLPVLVAGGMGVAPLIFLAEKLMERTPNTEHRTPLVLIGAKTKNQILCTNEFQDLGCDVKIATDDGSRGFKGKVTELLDKILTSGFRLQASGKNIRAAYNVQRAALIYACGPRSMLKEISRISKKYNIPAQVSLEEHMACGIGACLGCVVNTKEGFKRVCKEGPVFNADEIIW